MSASPGQSPDHTTEQALRDLLTDSFGRIRELYADLATTDVEAAHRRPGGDGGRGNPVAWLLWHLARVQDDHVAALAGVEQVWLADDAAWARRFDLPYDDAAHGYGQSDSDVDALRIEDLGLLAEYQEQVHRVCLDYVARADADELGRVVDERWDPPVTASARLVSVLGDCLQHLGQAAYVRGLGHELS